MLESYAAKRAAMRITREQLARMRIHNAQLKQAVDAVHPDVPRFIDHNRQFHAIILEAAASERLTSMLAQVTEQPVVLRTARQYDLENLRRSHHEHDELLIAFENRDGEWAAAVMTAHIRRAFHAYAEAHSTDTEIGKTDLAA
jgi:DNA-binding GntR family transcriptional regulator